jgi:hypothetical protein
MKQETKIDTLLKLRLEKSKLENFCTYQEKLIAMKVGYLKENYSKVLGETLLPYEKGENLKVSNLLDTVNGFITMLFPGIFKGKVLPEFLLKLIQIVMIRILGKKAKEER